MITITTARITGRGQITIPAELRQKHNLKVGDTVVVSENERGQITLTAPEFTFDELAAGVPPAPGADVSRGYDAILASEYDRDASRFIHESGEGP